MDQILEALLRKIFNYCNRLLVPSSSKVLRHFSPFKDVGLCVPEVIHNRKSSEAFRVLTKDGKGKSDHP